MATFRYFIETHDKWEIPVPKLHMNEVPGIKWLITNFGLKCIQLHMDLFTMDMNIIIIE